MEHTPVLPARARVESAERFLPSQAGIETISAVARALRGFDRNQLGTAIEVMIALLDVADGDPDFKTGNDVEDDFVLSPQALYAAEGVPGCPIADAGDPSYTEWHSRGRHKLDPGIYGKDGREVHEDAEEDDAPEEDDGDSAVDDRPCDEPYMDLEPDHDAEIEQMHDDVPALPVFTAEHNIFNDKRTFLGINAETWIGKPYEPA